MLEIKKPRCEQSIDQHMWWSKSPVVPVSRKGKCSALPTQINVCGSLQIAEMLRSEEKGERFVKTLMLEFWKT